MVVKVEEMVKAVRVAIDMNKGDELLVAEGDMDTLELDDVIVSVLEEAVQMVELEAPLELLGNGRSFGEGNEGVYIGEDGKGYVILPEDFMRLLCFRMSDWGRTVCDFISPRDAEYVLQSSRWVCGNAERPVVAIVRRNEGKVLEFYSCRSDKAVIKEAMYIPVPRIDRDGGIDVAEECYRAAVYRAATLALASLGDQMAERMLEISKALCR